jgi:hypothetical protein
MQSRQRSDDLGGDQHSRRLCHEAPASFAVATGRANEVPFGTECRSSVSCKRRGSEGGVPLDDFLPGAGPQAGLIEKRAGLVEKLKHDA